MSYLVAALALPAVTFCATVGWYWYQAVTLLRLTNNEDWGL